MTAGVTQRIRVLLADDQQLLRAGFASLLGAAPDLEVVGQAADGRQALDLARSLRPDVVVMDIRMPVLDGLEATRQLTADPALAAVRVLVLTTFELDEYVLEALRAGASGFLGKGAAPDELAAAVRVVARGEALLSPGATRALVAHFLARPAETAGAVPEDLRLLTEREREVLVLVAHGLDNDRIAERLVVSPLTAKTHVNRAMAKLGVRDRAQLVVIAYQSGLVHAGEV